MVDGKLDIAVGMSARSKVWKNKKWFWSDLVDKLLTEHKTNERYAEFVNASKSDQLKIKDVGGYVGGYLRNGRRKPENVLHRQLITLDLDFAPVDFWDTFTMLYGNAAVIHSTHKHTAKEPRLRLVMPLDREVTPDEYAAISRRVAGTLGIEYFDNTGFQSERLMFWPSSSVDAKYYAKFQDGDWLDADQTLASYVDWTDSSAWPTSQVAVKEVSDRANKQEDPTTKRGLIGAFCRSYTITEAIESFLTDEYVESGPDRWTYKNGSAAAGLVVYEDKFAFSHHGTDPVSNQLCNAFDLVRIHKFGHLDANLAPGNKSKSMAAMEEFCREDKEVKKTIAAERISDAGFDFAEEEEEVNNLDWAEDLEIDAKGKYLASAHNISLILANDPQLKGRFKENEFDDKKYVVKDLPWRQITEPDPIRNVDYSGIRNYIDSVYGIASVSKVDDALNLEFQKHSFHPIKEFLSGLEWDGESRIDELLIDYFGATDNVYTREAIRKMLVGAVARIFNPGVKFDLVLTLVGRVQGTGKSTFIRKLGGPWYSDSFHTVNGKEAFEQLQGAWLVEMAELSGVRKSEVEQIKHFITKQEDTYRPAYGRITETFKRRCVFFATTNERDFLRDPTGNRRFMPVDVNHEIASKSVFEDLGDEVNQIWAEAVELYKAGETLYLSEQAEVLARAEQASHSQQDDRAGVVDLYLNTPLPNNWDDMDLIQRRNHLADPLAGKGTQTRREVCVAEIWVEGLGRDKADMSRYNTREINDILRGLGDWEPSGKTKTFPIYGKQRYYVRI